MASLKKIFAFTLVALIVAVITYFYRPAAVVERALTELGEARTANFTTRIQMANSASTQQLLGEEGAVDMNIAGQWERQDGPDALAIDTTLMTQTESVSVSIQGDIRLIKDKLYLQVKKAPAAVPLLVQLKDQWIAVDRGAEEEDSMGVPVGPDLFASVKREGSETIDGVATVHYTATAKNDAIVKFMDALAEMLGTSLSEQQVGQIRESMTHVESIPIDVWVERWGSELKQLHTTLIVPGGTTVEFTLGIKSLNEPVTIVAPEGAATFQEVVKRKTPAPTPEPTPEQ